MGPRLISRGKVAVALEGATEEARLQWGRG